VTGLFFRAASKDDIGCPRNGWMLTGRGDIPKIKLLIFFYLLE
jgi:hypothetical protein